MATTPSLPLIIILTIVPEIIDPDIIVPLMTMTFDIGTLPTESVYKPPKNGFKRYQVHPSTMTYLFQASDATPQTH